MVPCLYNRISLFLTANQPDTCISRLLVTAGMLEISSGFDKTGLSVSV